jgi:uncharacterized protein involved in exopolysaccharide biosynthesis
VVKKAGSDTENEENAAPKPYSGNEDQEAFDRELADQLSVLADSLPRRINIDPDLVEKELAKLVLTLIEFIRRLLERQAVRRVEGGGLTPEQIENLGLALMRLEAKMQDLKGQLGLQDEDLNLDLGPLGRLI